MFVSWSVAAESVNANGRKTVNGYEANSQAEARKLAYVKAETKEVSELILKKKHRTAVVMEEIE